MPVDCAISLLPESLQEKIEQLPGAGGSSCLRGLAVPAPQRDRESVREIVREGERERQSVRERDGGAPWHGRPDAPLATARDHRTTSRGGQELQGYLAHKKDPPVGPYSSPMTRDL